MVDPPFKETTEQPDAPFAPPGAAPPAVPFGSKEWLAQQMAMEQFKHELQMKRFEQMVRMQEEQRAKRRGREETELLKARRSNAGELVKLFVEICGGPEEAKRAVKGLGIGALIGGYGYIGLEVWDQYFRD